MGLILFLYIYISNLRDRAWSIFFNFHECNAIKGPYILQSIMSVSGFYISWSEVSMDHIHFSIYIARVELTSHPHTKD